MSPAAAITPSTCADGVAVPVAVSVTVGVAVSVGAALGVAVGVAVSAGVVGVAVAAGSGVLVGFGVWVGGLAASAVSGLESTIAKPKNSAAPNVTQATSHQTSFAGLLDMVLPPPQCLQNPPKRARFP